MVEGARLESVFRGNSNVGSNPTLSAMNLPSAAGSNGSPRNANKHNVDPRCGILP